MVGTSNLVPEILIGTVSCLLVDACTSICLRCTLSELASHSLVTSLL